MSGSPPFWRERYGQWAVVTGASAGLGTDFARQVAERGMDVALVARRADRLAALAAQIAGRSSVQTLVVECDLSRPGAASEVKRALGDREVGLLINNAGFGLYGNLHGLSAARQVEMVRLNCEAPVALTLEFLPAMIRRGRGGVIFLASTAAYQATPHFAVYGATKGFNLLLGEALWKECRSLGVDVLAVSPGYTATEFQQAAGMTKGRAGAARSEAVVAGALKHLGKGPSWVHGSKNRATAFAARLFPRRFLTTMAGAVLQSMAAERK